MLLTFLFSSFIKAGAWILIIPPGSAQVGMGMTGVTYPRDIAGIYYNPAIVSRVKPGVNIMNTPIVSPWNLTFTELGNNIVNKLASDYYTSDSVPCSPDWLSFLYPGMKYTYGGIKFPEYKNISFALNFTMWNTGELTAGDSLHHFEWVPYDYVVGISGGYTYMDSTLPLKISAGLTLKYIYSFLTPSEVIEWYKEKFNTNISGGTGKAFTFDSGLLISDREDIISAGISYCNVKGRIRYLEGSSWDPLPKTIRLGFSFSPVNLVDYFLERYNNLNLRIGDYLDFRYSKERITDRVSEPYDEWDNWGWELSILNSIYFRQGHFDGNIEGGPGKCRGFGLSLADARIDFSDGPRGPGNGWYNYRLTINIKKGGNPNKYLAIPAGLLFPGGGHLYMGETKRGLIYSGIGTLFSVLQPLGSETRSDIYYGGFYAVSLVSLADLLYTIFK